MPTARSSPARRVLPLRLLAALGLLLALASPLLPIVRAAQDEITCPEGQVVDETTGACVDAALAEETPPPEEPAAVAGETAPAVETVVDATEPTKETEQVSPNEEATGPVIPIEESEPVDIPAVATRTATTANRSCESPIIRECADAGLDVIVFKYTCPQVPAPTGRTSYEEVLAACEPVGVGVSFTLDAAKGRGPEVRVTSPLGATGVPGARWEDQPFGAFTLTESPLADHLPPMVFCDVDYAPGSDTWHQVALDGWSYHGELIEGDYPDGWALACAWFNRWDQAALTPVPTEESEPPIAAATRAERDCPPGAILMECAGLDVLVYTYSCPKGTVPADLDSYEAHLAVCGVPAPGISFTFDARQAGNPIWSVTGADGPNGARWENQPFGPFTLTESQLPSHLPPAAFCDVDFAPKSEAWHRVVLDGWSYRGELVKGDYPDDAALICTWFNFPEWAVSVSVETFACPPGVTASAYDSLQGFLDACAEPQAGIDFTVTHEAAPPSTWQTDEQGSAAFSRLPFGAFTLAEAIPAGYGDPVVYCLRRGRGEQAAYVRVEAPGGVYASVVTAPDPPGDVYVQCLWFNLPEGEAGDDRTDTVMHGRSDRSTARRGGGCSGAARRASAPARSRRR